jgi:NADH-quinone oxidoreductase subunit E
MARFTDASLAVAHEIIARYPVRKSAVIPLCHLAQEQDGHLTDEAMAHVAELTGVTPAEVLGTASFYEMFKRHHVGRYLIGVCTGISCMLLGGMELLEHAEATLGVNTGATTDDGMFTLERMECLAACGGAPCFQANYRYFENVTHDDFDRTVAALRAGELDDVVPPHGTLSRLTLPTPQTDAQRVKPEEVRSSS